MLRHPLLKLDGKPVQGRFPVSNWQGPLAADVSEGQVEQLQQCLITRERATVLDDLAQAHVHRFNRDGGVNHLADFRRVVEERDDAPPVAPPGLADGWIGLIPFPRTRPATARPPGRWPPCRGRADQPRLPCAVSSRRSSGCGAPDARCTAVPPCSGTQPRSLRGSLCNEKEDRFIFCTLLHP